MLIEQLQRKSGSVSGLRALALAATVSLSGVVLMESAPAEAALASPLTRVFLDGEAGARFPMQQLTVDLVTASAGNAQGVLTFNFPVGSSTYTLQFAPPPGVTALAVGTYEGAQRAPFRVAGHPGIELYGGGAGCNKVSGRFIVDEITLDPENKPLTFSARFEHHCEERPAATFGAISYNATADFRSHSLALQKVNFGSLGSGGSRVLTETITNNGPSPFTISNLVLGGADAAQFSVLGHTCNAVPAGQTCGIDIRFSPLGPIGPRNAEVEMFNDVAPQGSSGRAIPLTGTVALVEGEFTPLTPARILDTRDGTGGYSQPLGPGETIDVQVTGVGGVPPSGVGSVVFNATAVDPTASTYFTVWPAGIPRPENSNVNVLPGETRPNLVTVAVGAGGRVSLFNNAGSTHAIFDIVGFYSDLTGPLWSRFHPLDPFRLFDTRDGTGGVVPAPIGGGGVRSVSVSSKGNLPYSGTTAVVLNVTVTAPTAGGYLTVFPGDVPAPTASNLNFVPNQTVPNLVIVRVPKDGVISFLNSAGDTHLIADVVGYFDTSRSGGAGRFIGVAPARILDTRISNVPLGPDEAGILPVVGRGNIPAEAGAAILNFTVTGTTRAGYLTVFPDDACRLPLASNLNFQPGDTVPNLVIVRLSKSNGCSSGAGRVDVYNSAGTTHVIADVFGYFTAA